MTTMKKILEVLEYSNTDIRFKTDLDFMQKPQEVMGLIPKLMMSMSAKLFGKEEANIFAVIRALIVSDLALSNNRKQLLKHLDLDSKASGAAFRETMDMMIKAGKATWIPNGSSSPGKPS